jgi:acyl-homoserine lactone acylase PvdQ
VDIETHKDWIAVRGRKTPVDFERDTTSHGVILAFDRERNLAFALRWSGSEPGTAAELGALALDRAASPTGFRAALARWKMPARRITFVDSGGMHSSRIAAMIPVRRGWTGALPVPGWNGSSEWAGWLPPADSSPAAMKKRPRESTILDAVRLHPYRTDTLLQRLAAAASARDSLTIQRAAMVDAVADGLRERTPQSPGVIFAHPLAVTGPARRRFNVGVPAPSPGAAADPFSIAFDPADWDRSTAISAPGQSESPDSPNFADLAKLWSEGRSFQLAFTDGAVQAHAAATLTLTSR